MKIIRIVFCVFYLCVAGGVYSQTIAKPESKNPLVGTWSNADEGTVVIRADGTMTIDGAKYIYKIKNSVMTIVGDDGILNVPFTLNGDTLKAEVDGREVIYKRVKPEAKDALQGAGAGSGSSVSGGVIQALVGKWCFMSNLTGSNARMSSRCFVLNADGTYEYSSETSSSGPIASSASQEYDTGRWTATQTSLTAFSDKHGKIVYPIELKNHPKTGDPMIVVDGDAYVTAFQKRPW